MPSGGGFDVVVAAGAGDRELTFYMIVIEIPLVGDVVGAGRRSGVFNMSVVGAKYVSATNVLPSFLDYKPSLKTSINQAAVCKI